jgi:hypothetical protein
LKVLLAKLAVIAAVAVAAFAVPAAAQGPPSHAKAYGKRCHGESRHEPHGDKGTPFSRCVKKGAHSSGKPAVKSHNEADENDNDQDENENEQDENEDD